MKVLIGTPDIRLIIIHLSNYLIISICVRLSVT